MDENEIEVVCNGGNLKEVSSILEKFLEQNEAVFLFPTLSENNKRVILWTALFQHLQQESSVSIHPMCLAVIRILSRDKCDLESLICEKWIVVLIERAGLYNFVDIEDEFMVPVDLPNIQITVEALKCLCNLTFNSEAARALCAHTGIAQGLVSRLRLYRDLPFRDDIMLFDMKLLFILTALRSDIKLKIKEELHGMDYLISCLNEILMEATFKSQEVGKLENSDITKGSLNDVCLLNDNQHAIVCEILKTQFNLIIHCGSEEPVSEDDEAMFLKLMPVLSTLLYAHTLSEEKLMDLRSNIANLLTSVPPTYYQFLTPVLDSGVSQCVFENRNMDALQALLELLQYRLSNTTNTKHQNDYLSPILTVMNKASRGCREQRKYLRQVVLPPLRDVSQPPEQGSALRNQLCRLLTTPVTSVRDLVAEFLFILCKEKVGRLVKYTGYGNAAGHLAQKGLLAGGAGSGADGYSSSSDSDTEEWRHARPLLDPVRGCTRPVQQEPMHHMTEEQKEYEAMKLVGMFDKLMADGVVQPARVGPDGRPQPLRHVLQLRDQTNS